MSKLYETVSVSIRKPRDGDPGIIEEGRYKTEGDTVVLVDIEGKPRLDKKGNRIERKIGPGENSRSVAFKLTRDNIPNRNNDFNRKIIYPSMGKF